MFNDGIHSSILCSAIDLRVDLLKLIVRLIIRSQENEQDRDYQHVFFQTSIDAEKFLKGIGGVMFLKGFVRDLKKSVDFELKLPFKKVEPPELTSTVE
jgi:hypothetical protein